MDDNLKKAHALLKKVIASAGELQANFYFAGNNGGTSAGLIITLSARDRTGKKALAAGKELRKSIKGAKFARGTARIEGSKLVFEQHAGTAAPAVMKKAFKNALIKEELGGHPPLRFLAKARIVSLENEAASEDGEDLNAVEKMMLSAGALSVDELNELKAEQGPLSKLNELLQISFLSAQSAYLEAQEQRADTVNFINALYQKKNTPTITDAERAELKEAIQLEETTLAELDAWGADPFRSSDVGSFSNTIQAADQVAVAMLQEQVNDLKPQMLALLEKSTTQDFVDWDLEIGAPYKALKKQMDAVLSRLQSVGGALSKSGLTDDARAQLQAEFEALHSVFQETEEQALALLDKGEANDFVDRELEIGDPYKDITEDLDAYLEKMVDISTALLPKEDAPEKFQTAAAQHDVLMDEFIRLEPQMLALLNKSKASDVVNWDLEFGAPYMALKTQMVKAQMDAVLSGLQRVGESLSRSDLLTDEERAQLQAEFEVLQSVFQETEALAVVLLDKIKANDADWDLEIGDPYKDIKEDLGAYLKGMAAISIFPPPVDKDSTLADLQHAYNSGQLSEMNSIAKKAHTDTIDDIFAKMLVSFQRLGKLFLRTFSQAGITNVELDERAASTKARKEFDDLVKKGKLEFNRTYGYVFWKSFGAPFDLQLNGGFPVSEDLSNLLSEAEKLDGPGDALQKARAKNVYDLIQEKQPQKIVLQEIDEPCRQMLEQLDVDKHLKLIGHNPESLLAMYAWTPEEPVSSLPELPADMEPSPELPDFLVEGATGHKLLYAKERGDPRDSRSRKLYINGHFISAGDLKQCEANAAFLLALLETARGYATQNTCDVFINCDANCVIDGSRSFSVKGQNEPTVVAPLPYLDPNGPKLPTLKGVSIEFNEAAPKTRGKSPLENQQFIGKGGETVTCATMITAIVRHDSNADTSVVALPARKLLDEGNTTDHQINYNAASGCLNLNLGFTNYSPDTGADKIKRERIAALKGSRGDGVNLWDELHNAFLVSSAALARELSTVLAQY